MEQIYTTKSLSELLQVSPSTIRRELDEGRISCFKVRGQLRFREADVQRYLGRRHLKRTKSETAEIVYLNFRQK
jgi:excisionase family DNA binding protein